MTGEVSVEQMVSLYRNLDRYSQLFALGSLFKELSPLTEDYLKSFIELRARHGIEGVLQWVEKGRVPDLSQVVHSEDSGLKLLQQLIVALPLLNIDEEVRGLYVQLFSDLIAECIRTGQHLEWCKVLFSVASTCPLFRECVSKLTELHNQVDVMCSSSRQNSLSQELNPHPTLVGSKSLTSNSSRNKPNLCRTLSIDPNHTPSTSRNWRTNVGRPQMLGRTDSGVSTSFESDLPASDIGDAYLPGKSDEPRLASRSRPATGMHHHPLTPQSSQDSIDDRIPPWKLKYENPHPGMAEIPTWLKSLRLHKYVYVFNDLTYHEIFSISESKLLSMDVTQGGARKLMNQIEKLKERGSILQALDQLLEMRDKFSHVLEELAALLNTPICPYKLIRQRMSEQGPDDQSQASQSSIGTIQNEDLPSWIVRILGKIFRCLTIREVTQEYLVAYISMLQRCKNMDAFTDDQHNRICQLLEFLACRFNMGISKSCSLSSGDLNSSTFTRKPINKYTLGAVCSSPTSYSRLHQTHRKVAPSTSLSMIGSPSAKTSEDLQRRVVEYSKGRPFLNRTKSAPINSFCSVGDADAENPLRSLAYSVFRDCLDGDY